MTEGGKTRLAPGGAPYRLRMLCGAATILALTAAAGSSAQAQEAQPAARLSFTKVLKGSVPEYVSLTVDADGQATYDGRQLADAPSPRTLRISAGTTTRLFSLAESLGYFRSLNLESRHKVADLGRKTLTYEANGATGRVEYNYTENRTAQELTEQFEKIANVEEHISQLEYATKYDPLSLPGQLRQIQVELNEHALLETALLVPTLEKIASNSRFLHLAQSRAQDILDRVREEH